MIVFLIKSRAPFAVQEELMECSSQIIFLKWKHEIFQILHSKKRSMYCQYCCAFVLFSLGRLMMKINLDTPGG